MAAPSKELVFDCNHYATLRISQQRTVSQRPASTEYSAGPRHRNTLPPATNQPSGCRMAAGSPFAVCLLKEPRPSAGQHPPWSVLRRPRQPSIRPNTNTNTNTNTNQFVCVYHTKPPPSRFQSPPPTTGKPVHRRCLPLASGKRVHETRCAYTKAQFCSTKPAHRGGLVTCPPRALPV